LNLDDLDPYTQAKTALLDALRPLTFELVKLEAQRQGLVKQLEVLVALIPNRRECGLCKGTGSGTPIETKEGDSTYTTPQPCTRCVGQTTEQWLRAMGLNELAGMRWT